MTDPEELDETNRRESWQVAHDVVCFLAGFGFVVLFFGAAIIVGLLVKKC